MRKEVITLAFHRDSNGVIIAVGHGENDFGCFTVEGMAVSSTGAIELNKTFGVTTRELAPVSYTCTGFCLNPFWTPRATPSFYTDRHQCCRNLSCDHPATPPKLTRVTRWPKTDALSHTKCLRVFCTIATGADKAQEAQ